MYQDQVKKSQDLLIHQYAPMVKKIAYHLCARLPNFISIDDLIQSGMIGLLEASKKYDPSKGASFETYSGIRIRGAMLDEIRKGDWTPRSVHKNSRKISDAIRKVENRTGRDASDTEIALEMGVSQTEYFNILKDCKSTKLFSLDEILPESMSDNTNATNSSSSEPFCNLMDINLKKSISQAIASLPEREQLVLALYYDEELNLKEIGKVLGVSESRVSQILSKAALRLKSRLKSWYGESN